MINGLKINFLTINHKKPPLLKAVFLYIFKHSIVNTIYRLEIISLQKQYHKLECLLIFSTQPYKGLVLK
ncbi:hypothetical protein BTO21_15205 [Photobacterium phosphoreum]|nr:hypothetical protein UB41_10645 [Photobacterium phosphoreum]PQJ86161.1 hypothetical protein BTO21_15205 [Photobacterium phosphoreum]PSV68895.1 hypothetical protein CTM77_16240 [Photobacterium phosphoreum]